MDRATRANLGEGMAAYAAPSLFQPHLARQAIRDAHAKKIPPLICVFNAISSIPAIRFITPFNYDSSIVDWEHSSCNIETMSTMVHEIAFISQGRTIPWVRVPGHDHAAIGWALDAGASIVVPQVDTVEQAQHVISATKFGTRQNGTRSAPPGRWLPGLTDIPYDPSKTLHECLNEQAAVMIQIESLEGINNLDDILTKVPDIDVVWLGSLDARISMNLPASFGTGGDEPEWLAAREKFFKVLDKHDKPYAGFAFSSPPYGNAKAFRKAAERMSVVAVTADTVHLSAIGVELQVAKEALSGSYRTNGVVDNI